MVFRVFIMSGLLINAACAITIFIFTQTQRDMNGKITFNVPTTLLEDQYNDQRYFQVRLGRERACVRVCMRACVGVWFRILFDHFKEREYPDG